ncbi:MAG TPA: uracil-DNA glycosylase [Candidatus Fermentibacter daniensis]|jgi:DNA polymerase|nr:uracil-DNA glycosylase [Candidatus Fermentibacter sp.]OQC70489.1 MAG: Uracil DNA glycosylase superfamily protein [candidate division Hyd24-12 bacterium ADurb.Bin004]HOA04472.1 uracil-DNA glycosylase [Candidatus Fermentibacter daniensis]MCC6872416.1 uracil-DNA glycosylase [Candidatus Fermentibacter sp.]HOD19637.1 uracil-DNA glycosylase [Candidatus Fermentibacter daniensis]
MPDGWSGSDADGDVRARRGREPDSSDGAKTAMDAVRAKLGDCSSCRLSGTRRNLVFGEGDPRSGILVVGEGPGASEDETGRPFVGKAGQLLDRILASIGLDRESCFIANVVKCRPPENRVPSPDEVEACAWVLDAQIDAMQPGVILALGATAVSRLLGIRAPIGQARNSEHSYRGIPVIVTYHPAALLRTPALKRPVWEDVKKLRRLMERGGLPRK